MSASSTFLGEVDLTEIDRIRNQAWTRRKVSYTAFVVKAVALALRDFPQANRRAYRVGFWPYVRIKFQSFTVQDVAVERDVPGAEGASLIEIIRAADETALDKISETVQALSKAEAIVSHLRRPIPSPKSWVEKQGGAVLVNLPPREGVDAVLGSGSHPIGISFGEARPRPVVADGEVVARPTIILSLNYDRRIIAGDQAARLFKRIVAILEKPTREIDELKVDRPPIRAKDAAPEVPIARGVMREAPPTRIDFPTIDHYQIPETEKSIDAPQTRDDFPTVEE